MELEEIGGDVQCVFISATLRLGLKDLADALLFQAEIIDLRSPVGSSNVKGELDSKLRSIKGLHKLSRTMYIQDYNWLFIYKEQDCDK